METVEEGSAEFWITFCLFEVTFGGNFAFKTHPWPQVNSIVANIFRYPVNHHLWPDKK